MIVYYSGEFKNRVGRDPMKRYPPLELLAKEGHATRIASFSALDLYFGIEDGRDLFVETSAGQVELAKLFDSISFPGIEMAEASLEVQDEEMHRYWFRCLDGDKARPAFSQLSLSYDPARRVFLDPEGIYPLLRAKRAERSPWKAGPAQAIFQGAILAARYGYRMEELPRYPGGMPQGEQRLLLSLLLSGKDPGAGFALLRDARFLEAEWPEVAELGGIDHSKDHHPEGGLWEHTMETFRHRKVREERLSLALLLHDSGKPLAASENGNRFDRHAEIGAVQARRFLDRLGYPLATRDEVAFLVKHHMLPHALPSLPLFRSQAALESPLFPLLLEVYRCDLSSTWRGPDGYYEACRAYRQYLKNVKNPYRSPEGTKYMKLLEKLPYAK
jgi:poly(A) polymerase